jgi:signal recognition particle receptor subunit beta
MVSINYSSREVCCKIVYYGPGLSGKTTNLQYVHAKVPQNTRGKLISLATEADRTLYFDFLPINIGSINGFTAKFQLYTVPGQVYYNATRKLVLRGVDGIVFVADSQTDKMDENIESLLNLEENLSEYGYNIGDLPVVIQFNKRDLPNVLSVEQLNARLNKRGWPYFEASATVGNGVFDTLKLIIKLVLDKAKTSGSSRMRTSTVPSAAPNRSATPRVESAGGESVTPDSRPNFISTSQSGRIQVDFPAAAESGRVPVQPAEVVSHEVPAYRPYPGSDSESSRERRVASPTMAPVQTPVAAAEEPPTATDHSGMMPEEPARGKASPQMAPSVRRRPEVRKRGFFKRLFGIK